MDFCLGNIVPGCTDETAYNYNPDATTDDGSCFFPSCEWSGEFCYDSNQDYTVYGYAVAPEGESIYLLFEQANIEDYWDVLYVYDGFDIATSNLLFSAGTASINGYEDFSGTMIESTSGVVVIFVDSDSSVSCQSSTLLFPIVWAAA